MITIETVKQRISDKYDPDEVIEILKISTEELLDAFEDKLIRRLQRFPDDISEFYTEDGEEEGNYGEEF